MVLKGLRKERRLAPLVVGTAQLDAYGLLGTELPGTRQTLLGTAVLLLDDPLGASSAGQEPAAVAAHGTGGRLEADEAAVLVVVVVGGVLDELGLVVAALHLSNAEH